MRTYAVYSQASFIAALLVFGAVLLLSGCGGDTTEVAEVDQFPDHAKVRLGITGMHCQGCIKSITEAVEAIDGVVACKINWMKNSAVVTVEDPAIAPKIIEAITGMNYGAELDEA